ncbi:MAG TPA: acyl-CoA synthetase [Acidobacteriota bacterium]|nr:acyl-CoA synthetase [Acidobacteriota bacterium]
MADSSGSYTYGQVGQEAGRVAACLLETGQGQEQRHSSTSARTPRATSDSRRPARDLMDSRIAFLADPGIDYVSTLFGIWMAGGVAVPLCALHPPREQQYVIDDTGARRLDLREVAQWRSSDPPGFSASADSHCGEEGTEGSTGLSAQRRAMILYTSGTTSRPKGVVTTHANIAAQVETLVEAWGWTQDDRILHVLPLHHTHGIVNAMLCAFWCGACVEFLPRFDAAEVWDRLASGRITLFMGVPTVYARLIRHWEGCDAQEQRRLSQACRELRLMVSGSAALPVRDFRRWKEISGHDLLERYGMTEIGMALSNPLQGERRPGAVGRPLPGVDLRLVDESGQPFEEEGRSGQIQVKGPMVFLEYWNRPEATAESFTLDGYFKTGDMAVVEDGYYRILGRSSVDIIKTGGYKVSALEIEDVLRTHPAIAECAVVGVPDPEWGERVCAALVPADSALDIDSLRAWCKDKLAVYKIPKEARTVESLPRNVLGKVTKPEIKKLFAAPQSGSAPNPRPQKGRKEGFPDEQATEKTVSRSHHEENL